MDKAPDAFRTISEVAEELDIPQHVLRFWETRFAQIKPMKRSGGRRYYRPDDVDLLKGIRRLLYGEGYTIRGVQRILKEHGIKSVQGLSDQNSAVSFGAVEEAIGLSLQEPDEGETPAVDSDDEDYESEDKGIDYRFLDPDEDGILTAEEVTALNLDGVEWAVLSACDTGLGEIKAGEGVFGLRRAFQIAGVRTVIMSLWSVDDQAARLWMRTLYERRLQKNLNTAVAVHEASLSVLRDRRMRGQSTHPFYWAGFVATGDFR